MFPCFTSEKFQLNIETPIRALHKTFWEASSLKTKQHIQTRLESASDDSLLGEKDANWHKDEDSWSIVEQAFKPIQEPPRAPSGSGF
jgi:hypothetical protein